MWQQYALFGFDGLVYLVHDTHAPSFEEALKEGLSRGLSPVADTDAKAVSLSGYAGHA
jgi:hypothetical protein